MRVIVACATVPATRPGDWIVDLRRSRLRIGSVVLVVWLVIGALAAYERNYFSSEPANWPNRHRAADGRCRPANYVGLNPKVDCPSLPQPSPDAPW